SPITVGGICNPDVRLCGPEPRKAGANAIIFSGIGALTPQSGNSGKAANKRQAEWVVFRVYIEDRGEGGGVHPRGATPPADIYCFQAWKTGLLLSDYPDPTSLATDLRHAVASGGCNWLQTLAPQNIGTFPPASANGWDADIVDQGPLDRGNHQIHPSTEAPC